MNKKLFKRALLSNDIAYIEKNIDDINEFDEDLFLLAISNKCNLVFDKYINTENFSPQKHIDKKAISISVEI